MFTCLYIYYVFNECLSVIIACHSESVHVAYVVWVMCYEDIFSEPRPYRGFQSVAMCLVLTVFGVRMWGETVKQTRLCQRVLGVDQNMLQNVKKINENHVFCRCWLLFLNFVPSLLILPTFISVHIFSMSRRLWGPPNNLDPTRPFMWFPGDCFCCFLSLTKTIVFSRGFRSLGSPLRFRGPDPCPIPPGYVRAFDQKIRFEFEINFVSKTFSEVFRSFPRAVSKFSDMESNQSRKKRPEFHWLIGFGCPVQSSLGLRQLDLCTGRKQMEKQRVNGWKQLKGKRYGFMMIYVYYL